MGTAPQMVNIQRCDYTMKFPAIPQSSGQKIKKKNSGHFFQARGRFHMEYPMPLFIDKYVTDSITAGKPQIPVSHEFSYQIKSNIFDNTKSKINKQMKMKK